MGEPVAAVPVRQQKSVAPTGPQLVVMASEGRFGGLLTGSRGSLANLIDSSKKGDFRSHAALYDRGILLRLEGSDRENVVNDVLQMAFRHNIRVTTVYTLDKLSLEQIYAAADTEEESERENVEAINTKMQANIISIIRQAKEQGASDIHIDVGGGIHKDKRGTKVEFRIDGVLENVLSVSMDYGLRLATSSFTMADNGSASTNNYDPKRDFHFRISSHTREEMETFGVRAVRCQIRPTNNSGVILVMRLLFSSLESAGAGLGIEDSGYVPQQIGIIIRSVKSRGGSHWIAGETGSGKTVAQAKILKRTMQHNRGKFRIMTLEDPPEIEIEGVVQTPLNSAAAQSDEEYQQLYRKAIKAAMRSDVDELVMGECRDPESAMTLIEFAVSGHKSRGTIHGDSPVGVIDRLRIWKLDENLITNSRIISSITHQTLVRRVCQSCRIPLSKKPMDDPDLDQVMKDIIGKFELDPRQIFSANEDGCPDCNQRGYKGRALICEVVDTDPTFMNHIRDMRPDLAVDHWRKERKGITLAEHSLFHMVAGISTPDDIESVIGPYTLGDLNVENMAALLKGKVKETA